jgi:1-acyl-sn-glycerol-3-phosphate acyltransferase
VTDQPARRQPSPLRPLAVANREPGGRTISGVIRFLHLFLRPLTRRAWWNADRLPQSGGVLIVVNHISNTDWMAVGQFVAFAGRWPRFLGKASVFKVPVVGRVLRACGQVPVERQSAASRDALAAATAALTDGRAVVIYPEGTITKAPGLWPMAGKTGAARLALATGCPVVPIGQWGAQDLMYGDKIEFPHLLPRKTLELIVGDPVDLDDLRGKPVTAETLREATNRIMDAITVLVAELRSEPAPAIRFDPRASPREEEGR